MKTTMTQTNTDNKMKTTMTKIHNIATKRLKLVTTILLASSMLATVTAAEQPTRYKLESKLVRSSVVPLLGAKGLVGAPTTAFGSIGDDAALRKWAVKWNTNKEISMLSSPSTTALEAQKAVIRMQSKVQYFERTKDGNFVLNSLPKDESAGISLSTTIKAKDKGSVSVDILLQINTLRDREKIPEVSLDVGRPVMQTQKIKTKLTMPLGQWMWIGTQKLQDVASGKHQHLLFLCKVTPVDKD